MNLSLTYFDSIFEQCETNLEWESYSISKNIVSNYKKVTILKQKSRNFSCFVGEYKKSNAF